MINITSLSHLFKCYDNQKLLFEEYSNHPYLNNKAQLSLHTNSNVNSDIYYKKRVMKLICSSLSKNLSYADKLVEKLNKKEDQDYGCNFKYYDYARCFLSKKSTDEIAELYNTSRRSVNRGIAIILGDLF